MSHMQLFKFKLIKIKSKMQFPSCTGHVVECHMWLAAAVWDSAG